jgi:hypothetical protein
MGACRGTLLVLGLLLCGVKRGLVGRKILVRKEELRLAGVLALLLSR